MRLFNAVAIFDVFVVAETSEAARDCLQAAIKDGADPNESRATQVTSKNSIRSSWQEQRPFVASDVSEDDFEKCKGKTTMQIFEQFYERRG